MKEKFEKNVAVDIPKTKRHEPRLPWKLSDEDAGPDARGDDTFKTIANGTGPLKVRAPFMILLVITIFLVTAYLISSAIMENEKMRNNMARKESELSLMQINLMKAAAEKEAIAKNSAQLEKKLGDLTAQKELFASVIESLTKKGDESDVDKKE
jgi:hypothetical protein